MVKSIRICLLVLLLLIPAGKVFGAAVTSGPALDIETPAEEPESEVPELEETPEAEVPEPEETPVAELQEPEETPAAESPEPEETPAAESAGPEETPAAETPLPETEAAVEPAVSETINVELPMSLDFVIDPLEMSERGSVYSDTYIIENHSDCDVVFTFSDINVLFSGDKNFLPLAQPYDAAQPMRENGIYLTLDFGHPSLEPVVVTAADIEPFSVVLSAPGMGQSSCVLTVSGNVNPYPAEEWENGDVGISLRYSIDPLFTPELLMPEPLPIIESPLMPEPSASSEPIPTESPESSESPEPVPAESSEPSASPEPIPAETETPELSASPESVPAETPAFSESPEPVPAASPESGESPEPIPAETPGSEESASDSGS